MYRHISALMEFLYGIFVWIAILIVAPIAIMYLVIGALIYTVTKEKVKLPFLNYDENITQINVG